MLSPVQYTYVLGVYRLRSTLERRAIISAVWPPECEIYLGFEEEEETRQSQGILPENMSRLLVDGAGGSGSFEAVRATVG